MSDALNNLAFISLPGHWELLALAVIGLLIFGKRLPEVGKSLGRSIVEFKKGLKGVEDDLDRAIENDQKDMLPPPESTATSEGSAQSTSEGSTQSTEPATPANSTETPA